MGSRAIFKNCVFCQLIMDWKRNPETSKLTQMEPKANVFMFEPLDPVVPGHILFIAAMHTSNAADNPYLTDQVFCWAAKYAQQQLEPFNLITSAGKEATQSVWHTHIHYVPRKEKDGLKLPWSEQLKRDNQ